MKGLFDLKGFDQQTVIFTVLVTLKHPTEIA